MAYEFIQVNIASSKIGALLMTQPYYDTVWASSLQNHALIYANKVITDSIGWTKISCSFVADSAYEYLATGNFFVDSLV
nr:hypothetical protein [Bacteroidota bacterium]